MHNYSAYGISISSEISLPEFIPRFGSPDVTIRYSRDTDWMEAFADKDYHVEIKHDWARFWFKQAGGFIVREGRNIEVIPIESADESLIRLYVEGMIMAMLLHQRGFCVLHASVVSLQGRAVAFLGPVGAGKSSFAAAMHARGHAVISDDNAAVRLSPRNVEVEPAYPYVKLFPAVAAALGYGGERLHVLHASQEKMAGIVDRNFALGALPLDRLYILRRASSPEIRPLAETPLLLELIRNSVPTRWGCTGDGEHLQRCGNVARRIPAFTFKTFENLAELPELAERVERHCLTGRESTVDFEPALPHTAEPPLPLFT
jgi:hypothetical protein